MDNRINRLEGLRINIPALSIMDSIGSEIAKQQKAIQKAIEPISISIDNALKIQAESMDSLKSVISKMDAIEPIKVALSPNIDQISEAISGINTKMNSATIASQMQEIGKSMSRVAGIMKSFPKQANIWEALAEQSKNITESFRPVREAMRKYRINERKAIPILQNYKWIVSPSMPISFIASIVEIGKQSGTTRKMNKLFVDYFIKDNCSTLENMTEGWFGNEIFSRRKKIIRDCVQVMKKEDRNLNSSNVVLPTLIAQIDGIQKEFMKKNGLSYKDRGKWVDEDGIEHHWKDWYRNITSNDELMSLANDLLLDVLFHTAYPLSPKNIPFHFNRHKIMHGEYLRYGGKRYTVRAFLLLDFLESVSG